MSAPKRWNDPFRVKPDPHAAVSRHRGRLMEMSDVVSVGLGFDVSHRTVIVVGVASEEIAGGVDVPRDLDGVPVEVRVVGTMEPRSEGPDDDGAARGNG